MEQDHWRQWWGEQQGELDSIRDMVAGRDSSRPFLFSVDGAVTGYIQYWFIGHHQNKSWVDDHPWLALLPEDAIGVDLSIGSETMLSKGVGSMVLATFVERLQALGYATIIIDPDASNNRAIRAYKKAGFRVIEELKNKTGDVLLMAHQGATHRI